MLEKNILDSIVSFFKSIGTKKASGEPIDLGRNRPDFETEEKKIHIKHDVELKVESTSEDAKEPVIEITPEKPKKEAPKKSDQKAPVTVVAKVRPRRVFSAEVEALRGQYPWRKLKAEEPLTPQTLPEPFYFLTSDNQPVEASKLEISFVKELLTKAAEAGIENKFTFSLSSAMSVTVKYKKKLVGRVYLHGRKHHMTFKSAGKTVTEDNLNLSDCKKLIPIWIGQIKEF